MSRLPSALQPAWPLFKRAHRFASLVLGIVNRRTSRIFGARALPHRATVSSDQTVALEPAAVILHRGSGDGEDVRREPPAGDPANHWIFEANLDYDVPRRFTLEITDGTVVGDYGANLTSGGILDYESSPYFGITGWREHPIFLRARLPAAEHFDGTLLTLATRGGSANYYHYLLDVLPRWGVFRETMPGRMPDALYIPSGARYQKQFLNILGLDTIPIIETGKHRAVTADKLLVPCMPNPDLVAPRWTIEWLKEQLPTKNSADAPSRLYLTRGDQPNTRRLVNEQELWPLLEKQGFVRVDPGTLTVQEQIDWFAAAEVIVAPHGAALANLAFCSPGVRVLELFAPNYVNVCYWNITENIDGARYRYLVGGDPDSRPVGSPMNGVLTDIEIERDTFAAALEDLLS